MDSNDLTSEVKQILARHAPVWAVQEMQEDLPVGREGLGLDSISIAEVLVTIDERFGIPFSTILFESGPLTVGKLIRFVQDGGPERTSLRRAA